MNNYLNSRKLSALQEKGGIMLFTVTRGNIIYKGTIMLSPVQDYCQKRAVYINEYKYYNQTSPTEKGGAQ